MSAYETEIGMGSAITILWCILNLACLYHFTRRNLSHLEALLRNSRWVKNNLRLWPGKHPINQLYRIGCITAMLWFPHRFHTLGEVDASDLQKVPADKRRQLAALWASLAINMCTGAVLVLLTAQHA